MTGPNEPWFSQDEMDSRYGVNDPFREIEGYGLPCVLCGDEGHHVPGHERTQPTASCEPGCRHRCPACRMGLVTHLECDPRCEARQPTVPEPEATAHAGFTRGSRHPGPAAKCPVEFCRTSAPDLPTQPTEPSSEGV